MRYARWETVTKNGRHSVQVSWFPSRRAYLSYLRKKYVSGGLTISGKGTAAKMLGFSAEQIAAGDPNAELVFYREQFDNDSIAHEVSHALIVLFKEQGRSLFDDDRKNEEEFATLHGKLTATIIEWRQENNLAPI